MTQTEKLIRDATTIEVEFVAVANPGVPTFSKRKDGTVVIRIETRSEDLNAAFAKESLTKLKERKENENPHHC